jgi:hypothetical protein
MRLGNTFAKNLPNSLKPPYYRVRDFAQYQIMRRNLLGQIPIGNGCPTLSYLCHAGLANRLRAHIVASALALRSQRKLIVRWPKNQHCGATFSDLFVYNDADCHRADKTVILRSDIAAENLDGAVARIASMDGRFVLLRQCWQYISPRILAEALAVDGVRALIVPKVEIEAEVRQEMENWPGPMLGVHLRRGDFVSAGCAVPIERYNLALEAARKHHSEAAGVFLATDATEQELDGFHSELPVYRRHCGGRTTRQGVASALIDMLLLSRTKHVVLTPLSTFGELAALYGDIPFSIA